MIASDSGAIDVRDAIRRGEVICIFAEGQITRTGQMLPFRRGFMAELHRQGQSRASVSRKLSALRAFMRYLKREGWIVADPAALKLKPPKIPCSLRIK